MPFLGRCLFCSQRVRLPDGARGACIQCPKCASYYTVVPEEEPPRRTPAPAPQPAREAVQATVMAPNPEPAWWEVPPTPVPPTPPGASAGADPPAAPAKPPESLEAAQPAARPPGLPSRPLPAVPSVPREEPRRLPGLLDGVGLAALLLSGAAVLCVPVLRFSGLVVPLGALGLLTGVAAVVLGRAAGRPSSLPAALGAAVGGTVLLAALLSPGPGGSGYRPAWERAAPNPGAGPAGPPTGSAQGGMPLEVE